jgi:Cytochrome P460
MRVFAIAVIAATAAAGIGSAAVHSSVAYPEGYRAWRHIKSMVIQPEHALYASFGGIHHLYANANALRGYRTGKFPDGSVIVFDLLEAKDADHAITEGARKVLGVMQKDSKRFAATGGWGFEGFGGGAPDKRVVGENAATDCFSCHQAQAAASDYVFSKLE